MKRHMARNDMNLNEFEVRLSDETRQWIDNDPAAKVMYDTIIDSTRKATDWYNMAVNNPEITKWVPQQGGGDCYLVYPAEMLSQEALSAKFMLLRYAESIGRRQEADNIERAAECAYMIAELNENR